MKYEEIRKKLIEGGWYAFNPKVGFNPPSIYWRFSRTKDNYKFFYVLITSKNPFVLTPSLDSEVVIKTKDVMDISSTENSIIIDCYNGMLCTFTYEDDGSFVFDSKIVHTAFEIPEDSFDDYTRLDYQLWKPHRSYPSLKDMRKTFESFEEFESVLQTQTEEDKKNYYFKCSIWEKHPPIDYSRKNSKSPTQEEIEEASKKYWEWKREQEKEEYVNPYKSGLEPY